jgi:hypothetical protein
VKVIPATGDSYLTELNLLSPEVQVSENDPQNAALSWAHELRKLEIENYWKRANYFWLFQAASLTLFGLIASSKIAYVRQAFLAPAALGAVTAMVGWRSAIGSKFWQQNWESHVDLLERRVHGNLMKVVIHHGQILPSVSRVNQRLFILLFFSWTGTFVFLIAGDNFQCWLQKHLILTNSLSAILFIVGLLSVCLGTNSSLETSKEPRKVWENIILRKLGRVREKTLLMTVKEPGEHG